MERALGWMPAHYFLALTLPLTCCIALDKPLGLVKLFPQLQNEDDSSQPRSSEACSV